MVQTPTKLTFEEWLTYDDGTDTPYALADGELVEMSPETARNRKIATWLLIQFYLRCRIPSGRLSTQAWVQVSPIPVEPGDDKATQKERRMQTRKPDLTLLREELPDDRPDVILLDMEPPDLVVEVVSPGTSNRKRDYDAKMKQYRDRGIPEYWLIDPDAAIVTVCKLVDVEGVGKVYDLETFYQDAELVSDVLPDFHATVAQILAAEDKA